MRKCAIKSSRSRQRGTVASFAPTCRPHLPPVLLLLVRAAAFHLRQLQAALFAGFLLTPSFNFRRYQM
jgi:hypothetical protein